MSRSEQAPNQVLSKFHRIHLAGPIVNIFSYQTNPSNRLVLDHPVGSLHTLQLLGQAKNWPASDTYPNLTMVLNDVVLSSGRGQSLSLGFFFEDIDTLEDLNKDDNDIKKPIQSAQVLIFAHGRHPGMNELDRHFLINGYDILVKKDFKNLLHKPAISSFFYDCLTPLIHHPIDPHRSY